MTFSSQLRSLRVRLLVVALLLTAVGMAVVNVIALVTLRSSLLARVDQELMAIPAQVQGPLPDQTPPGNLPNRADSGSGFFSNLVVTSLDAGSGEVTNQLVGPVVVGAPMPDLSSVTADIQAGAVTDELQTVGAVGDPGYHYRIRVLPSSVDGETVVVVGKSLADLQSTVTKVAGVDAAVSGLIFVGLVMAGVPVIRVGLRPLTDVEQAAQRLGAGELGVRVPHTDEAGEVGSLARTFNSMADSIEEAFGERDASEQQLRQFIADASHELRTPLTTIRAYSELYSRDPTDLDPELRVALQRIEAESTRMSRLVDDLLVLARMDQQPDLVRETVDLATVVEDLTGDLATASPTHHVVLSRCDRPSLVVGNEASLSQLTSNLLRNAVIHTPPGTTVRVSLANGDGQVALTVTDDGPGMSREEADRAFERFYRPQPGRTRAGGAGLGLAIVEAVARAHDGTVLLDTSPGAGAAFTVVLPVAQPVDICGKP